MSPKNRIWLIRHADHSFSRPIPEEKLLEYFASGEMKPKDEVCPANGYWFSLQDVREMRKHFGNIPMDTLFSKSKDAANRERFTHTEKIVLSSQSLANPKDGSGDKNTGTFLMIGFLVLVFLGVMIYVWLG